MRMMWTLSLFFFAATVLGLGTGALVLTYQAPFGTWRDGVWEAWPNAGSPASDPYQRAVLALGGRIALGAGEGLVYTARHDARKRPLNSACDYILKGRALAARLWTLAAYDQNGSLLRPEHARPGISSDTIAYASDGSFAVTASTRARPWNWLPLHPTDNFVLVLTLYDSSRISDLDDAKPMPTLVRGRCR